MSEKHTTGPAKVLFAATTRPVDNKYNGKKEYKLRVELDATDPALAILKAINEDIVDTKANRAREDKSRVVINFTSGYVPTGKNMAGEYILDKEGNVLDEDSAFINTNYDEATVTITFKPHAKRGVNLVGFNILSLTKGERPAKEGDTTLADLKAKIQQG